MTDPNTPFAKTPRELRSIECNAAKWAVRRQEGLAPAEVVEFDRWIRADGHHAQVFAEMAKALTRLDRLRPAAFAPEIQHEGQGSGSARGSSFTASWLRWWLAAGTLAATAALAVVFLRLGRSASMAPVWVVATKIGDFRKMDLPDGSVVQLNTDSEIEVRYSASERHVRLARGEAFFSVVHNPARPFLVEAGAVSVRDIGTAFNVRYRNDALEVLVTAGKVQVNDQAGHSILPTASAAAAERLLVAGEKAAIPLQSDPLKPVAAVTISAPEPRRIGNALAWRENRLEFSSVPLGEVVADFNRYNRHKLVIDDPGLAAQHFGGSFAPHDYDSFIEVLEQGFGVTAERTDAQTILRRAK